MNQLAIFNDRNSEAMFALAKLLEGGRPLHSALESIAYSCQNYRLRDGMLIASEKIKEGESCEAIFSSVSMFVLPAFARYFLACPIPDRLKGSLMSGWLAGRNVFSIAPVSIYYPLQTLGVGLMSGTSMLIFVLPQFHEIMLGLKIETPWILNFFFNFTPSPFNPWTISLFLLILLVLAAVFTLARRFLSLRKVNDQIALLSILSSVEPEQRTMALTMLGNEIIFPSEHEKIKTLANAIKSGKTPAEACELAGIPMGLRWFIIMGFESENSSEMLDYGHQLLKNVWNAKIELLVAILEVSVILILGAIFGSMIYAVFSGMSAILMGSIQ